MRIRTAFIIGLLLGALLTGTLARAQERKVWLWGLSSRDSCGAWLTGERALTSVLEDKQRARDDDVTLQALRREWVYGFISGATSANEVKPRGVDHAGLTAAMDKYCTAEPTQGIAKAAAVVFLDIIE